MTKHRNARHSEPAGRARRQGWLAASVAVALVAIVASCSA
jgi:hypothetical protein